MAKLNLTQMSFDEVDEEYKAFIDKFKPKKTTDDCYTPANIYEVIKDWVVNEYGIDPEKIVRPFWPGGDYEKEKYPIGCTVLDNPPFSILSAICKKYLNEGIKFFLFAPSLTLFSTASADSRACLIVTSAAITYENGAVVSTSFITNLDAYRVRSAPDLKQAIEEQDELNRRDKKTELPVYRYPENVLTSPMVARFAKYGIDFRLKGEDLMFVRALDEQRRYSKVIFGGGFLLTEKAAAEKAAAEKAAAEKAAAEKANVKEWALSEREKDWIKMKERNNLGNKHNHLSNVVMEKILKD